MKLGKRFVRSYRMASLIAVIALLPLLAACSSGGSEGTPSPSPSASSPPPSASSSSSETPAAERDPVTLTVLAWFIGPNQALFDKFHEMYPWITIEANTNIDKAVVNNVIAGEGGSRFP